MQEFLYWIEEDVLDIKNRRFKMENENADIIQLRYLNTQYEKVTLELNDKLIELGQAKSRVQIVDAEAKKLGNMQNLVLENIRCEKKFFDINRR